MCPAKDHYDDPLLGQQIQDHRVFPFLVSRLVYLDFTVLYGISGPHCGFIVQRQDFFQLPVAVEFASGTML